MALWEQVQTLDVSSLKAVVNHYENKFPIEVRHQFASFIEDEVLGKKLDAENPNHLQSICTFIDSLIEQIENRIKATDIDTFLRLKLSGAVDQFKNNFGNNQLGLFRAIKDCLEMDVTLTAPHNFVAYERDEILNSCKIVKDNLSKRVDFLNNLDQKQTDFEIYMNDRSKYDAFITQLRLEAANNGGGSTEKLKAIESSKAALDKKIQEIIVAMRCIMMKLESDFAEDLQKISLLQEQILNKLLFWKYEQQQVANGATGTLKVDKLQLWCEEQAEIIWLARENIRKAERIKQVNQVFIQCKDQLPPDTIPGLNAKTLSLLTDLLQASFLVVEQPPQVMKQPTKFANPVSVRHLAGHILNSHMTPATVTVRVIDEATVKTLKEPNCGVTDRGGITNGSRALDYNKDTRIYSTTFKNGQLKGFRRLEKKGVGLERVMEDKFVLYFETVLSVADMKFKIWTISLPAVVISHGSQEAQAVATITYDNAFGAINREPFVVPCRVPWAELSNTLSLKFGSITGKELSLENILTLEKKLFRGAASEFVTWTEFCKDNMTGNNFSFWTWCYDIIKLVEKYLKGPWCEGSIMGIIEREKAEFLLKTCPAGTFLARFSDSRLGAISISWIHSDGKVYSINPLTKNDLSTKGFADTVMDLDKLQYLYPDIPKAVAFGKHRKASLTSPTTPNPYVDLKPDINVPGSSSSPSPNTEYPNPWSFPHSPARSSFSDAEFTMTMDQMMDMESQPSASGYEEQFKELLTLSPDMITSLSSSMNGNGEHHFPLSNNNIANMYEDDDMSGNGKIAEEVIRVFQENGIHNDILVGANGTNGQMGTFTQL